jgi:putative thioredoxin
MSDTSELVFTVVERDFEAAVIERSRTTPVVVDFWAPWCGPCRALAPVLERLVARHDGMLLLAKVNTDEEQGLAVRYGINALPTVVAFRDGKPVLSFEGLLPENQLADFLARVLPTEADQSARTAIGLEKTNPQQAEKLYRQALKADARQEEALLGLARLLIARYQDGEAAELLERVSAPENAAEAERLGALLWLRRQAQALGDERTLRERLEIDPGNAQLQFELGAVLAGQEKSVEALDLLMRAAQVDRKLAANRVRETMVQLFHLIGVRSPLADEYRSKLSALLY